MTEYLTLLNYDLLFKQMMDPVLVSLQSIFLFSSANILFHCKISHASQNPVEIKDLPSYGRNTSQENKIVILRLSKPMNWNVHTHVQLVDRVRTYP